MRLENRVAIVTGAGRNIGEAIAIAFAGEGAKVAVVDVRREAADAVAAAINKTQPGAALAVAADVSSESDVERMVAQVNEQFGGIDVLVNNAALTDHTPVLELEEEEWDRVLAVSLKSVFLCTKHAGKRMVEQGRGGRIINIASTSGHRGRPDATAYSAAKAGVLNLTRTLAIQLSPYGIRVNSITPNRVGSPVGEENLPEQGRGVSNLVGRQGMPPDIAAAAVFLASDEADFMAAADMLLDGGSMAGGMPFQVSPPKSS